jgi:Heparinase II/III-like protein/Heparinase II/III N-terminus
MSTQIHTQITPRPVFCVIEHAYRNLALAEDVCAGRFTHAGITLELGTEPDWLTAGLSEDEEWRIEWSKFYYGLDLASAYAETGDSKFLRTWERLVQSWIRQVGIDSDPTDVIGRRIQNWIYAWNAFAAAPHFSGLSEGLDEEIAGSLAQQVEYLRHHLSAERNHRTLELYALFIAALALPEIADGNDLLSFSMEQLYENLLTDIRPDGVHREHSTHYHMLVLRSFLAARENARRFGLNFPKAYDARLERACQFAMHCHRPDGEIPALSDSDTGSYTDVLRLAASLLERPDFLYAATAGTEGVAPDQRYVSFPDGGYYVQRSGWGLGTTPFEQERFLIFDCGPLGDGGHGHYDLLSVEIGAGGNPLIVDPGRYTYAEETPNLRRWFKGTAAHNTVCVDGLDQIPYRRGKPKLLLPEARFIDRWSAPGFDMLCGVAKSPSYEVIHTRRIFFVGDEYWIIYDRLRGNRPHRFNLRFHLSPAAWNHTTMLTREDTGMVLAPGFAMVFNPGNTMSIEPGWFAPQYGVKHPAPVVSVAAEGGSSTEFFTLVVPVKSADHIPTLKTCPDRADASDAICVEVSGVGPNRSATDHVVWSSSIMNHELGPFQCRASGVWSRSSGEACPALVACNVQELRWKTNGKAAFLTGLRPTPWLSWDEQRGLVDGKSA